MCGTSASFLRLAGGGAIGSSSSMCDPTEDGGERGDGAAALPGRDALGLWLWLALIHSRHTMRQWAGVSEARWKIIYQTRAGCPSRFSRDSGRVTPPGGGGCGGQAAGCVDLRRAWDRCSERTPDHEADTGGKCVVVARGTAIERELETRQGCCSRSSGGRLDAGGRCGTEWCYRRRARRHESTHGHTTARCVSERRWRRLRCFWPRTRRRMAS